MHKTLLYVVTNRISSSWPHRFLDLVCALLGKMVEISVEAKFHYDAAPGERILAVHHFHS